MHGQNEKFNKETVTIEETQTEILELKNRVTELKNSIKSFKSRLNHAVERISNLKNRTLEVTLSEEQKENVMKKNEDEVSQRRTNIT